MKFFCLKLIKFYQVILSPDQGIVAFLTPKRYCKHYPTCSRYTSEVIEKYGCIKGGWLGLKRIIRCNPFF